jgi:predicted HTH domain antitoxin
MKFNLSTLNWISKTIEATLKKRESQIDREDKNLKIIIDKLEESHVILSEITQSLSLMSATINLQEELTTTQFNDLYINLRNKLNRLHAIADLYQIPVSDLVQELSNNMDGYRGAFNIVLIKNKSQEYLDPKDYYYQQVLECSGEIKASVFKIQSHIRKYAHNLFPYGLINA